MYRIYNENAKTCNACNAVGFRSEISRFPSLKCFQSVAKKKGGCSPLASCLIRNLSEPRVQAAQITK
jgi:hypothetical protein